MENATEANKLQELINKGDKLAIGKALLEPLVDVIDYESTAGKLFTYGKCSENATKIDISVPLNLYYLDTDKLAMEQERARHRLLYLHDTAALRELHQEHIRCKTYEEAFDEMIEIFDRRKLEFSHAFVPRAFADGNLSQFFADEVDRVGQRELIMAGFIGLLRNVMLLTSAKTFAYDLIPANELIGVDTTKCIMEITAPLECVKDLKNSYGVLIQGTIKFEVTDPNAVVWAKIGKK